MFLFIISFLIAFIVCYIIYIITISVSNKKYKQSRATSEMLFLKLKFNIDYRKVGYLKMRKTIALINSFIFALTFAATTFTTNFVLIALIALVMLVILTLIFYTILGKHYIKKGYTFDETI